MTPTARVACFVVATLVASVAPMAASAEPPPAGPAPAADAGAQAPKASGQGLAVLAVGSAKDEAFSLARAIYATHLRPAALDEVRARVLAGAAPPPNASRALRDVAELRAGITGEDAAARQLLAGLAQQLAVEALVVVRVERRADAARSLASRASVDAQDAGAGAATVGADAGVEPSAPAAAEPPSAAGNASSESAVVARLFLASSRDFDAARYMPEPGVQGPAAWSATVASLDARFGATYRQLAQTAATAPLPPTLAQEQEQKRAPFYASGWFWGALGGAALLGAAFYFTTRDTSSEPIHLQMRVPR